MTFGTRMKIIRELTRLNQSKFAEKIGVQQSFISKVEKNNASLTIDQIILLKTIFDFDANWLLTGQGHAPDKKGSPVVTRIDQILETMDEEAQRDVLKYVEKERQFADLIAENQRRKVRPKKGLFANGTGNVPYLSGGKDLGTTTTR